MRPERSATVEVPAPVAQEFTIVLSPVSHPELGDIHIDDSLFAVGRTESPFDSYDPGIIADLSRRHARIFSEFGTVYVADLGSKNGTTVNGARVRQKPSRLRSGDELCFGQLCYRVQLDARGGEGGARARVVGVVLNPEHADFGLQPLVITRFPFLVSKADEVFSRYREQYPHQVNYISRRHAHIFLKGGAPYLEDLGSTNGTFVAGNRLDEHAVPLREGDVVAFGGDHFVYRVGLQTAAPADPTVTKLQSSVGPGEAGASDKTTFVAAADSFLDIFCVDQAQGRDEEPHAPEGDTASEGRPEKPSPRSRFAATLDEVRDALGTNETARRGRVGAWGAGLAAMLLVLVACFYWRGAPERELRDLLARGNYARAAIAAGSVLEGHPDSEELRALATEALVKASVPPWMAQLRGRDFAGATATLARMRELGRNDPDIRPIIDALDKVNAIEAFVIGRGGIEAPIRVYGDEESLKAALQPWEKETLEQQRAFTAVSALVPDFADLYAQALSHLRRLQSDDAVYLAAIGRLKGAIATELDNGRTEALADLLKDYGEKYPRLAGLDKLNEDLRRYMDIENEARAGNREHAASLLAQAPFSTPSFRARQPALAQLVGQGRDDSSGKEGKP